MKTKLYVATCLLIAAGLVSCQKQEFAAEEPSLLNYVEDLRIEKSNRNLTPEEAVNVARLYVGANAAVKPVTTKSAGDIYTIRDYDGEPVAYAVNNAGGEGFIIVGASKNYYPILAQAEKGHFDESCEESSIDVWVDEQIVNISACKNLPEESTRYFKLLWSSYEKMPSHITKSGIGDILNSAQAQWSSSGWHFSPLRVQPDGLPDDIYESWCEEAYDAANPNYDYMEYSYILRKVVETPGNTYGPCIQTTWHQLSPYNSLLNGLAVGCGPLSVAMIMKHHQYPTNILWSNISYVQCSTTLQSLLVALGHYCNSEYETSPLHTSTTNGDIQDCLSRYGYYSYLGYYNYTDLKNNLQSNRPVILGGDIYPDGRGGHFWICSGYRCCTQTVEYQLMIVNNVSEYVLQDFTSIPLGAVNNFFMNWGQNDGNDGWFIGNDVDAGDYNFCYNRSMIKDIHY